ncbi:MAG: gliding motility-associated C-terminal domain-containing protein, partial [Candidatus Nanopelagicaceae bacterium]
KAVVSSPKEPSMVSTANIVAPPDFIDRNTRDNHSTTQVFVKPVLTTSNVKVRSGTKATIDLTSTPNSQNATYMWTAAQSSHAAVNGYSNGEGTSIKQVLTAKGLSGIVAYTVMPSVRVNRVLPDGSIGEVTNIAGDPKTIFVNVVTNPTFALSPKLPIAYGSFAANLADPAIIGNSTNIDYYQYFDRTGKTKLTTTKVPAGDYYVEGYTKAGFSSGRQRVHIAAGPQPTLVITTDKTSLIEGERAHLTLSLSPSTVRLQEDLAITLNCTHNQFNSKNKTAQQNILSPESQQIACNIPGTVTIPAGSNKVTVPVETLADNILYNDELLAVKAENPNLESVTSKLSIEDATSLNPDNLVITLDGGTLKDNNTLKVTARLPRGITTAKDITIALSEDQNRSNLSSLSKKPSFPASVTIPGDSKTNFSEFDVSASNPNGEPAKLVLNGTCIDCKINAQPIAILNQKTSPNEQLTASSTDIYRISNINRYSKNEVQIVNRWGVLVYQAKGYDNEKIVFKGRSNRGYIYDLPTGTYYYVALLFDQKKKDIVQGSFQIKRENENEQIGAIDLNKSETSSPRGHM